MLLSSHDRFGRDRDEYDYKASEDLWSRSSGQRRSHQDAVRQRGRESGTLLCGFMRPFTTI